VSGGRCALLDSTNRRVGAASSVPKDDRLGLLCPRLQVVRDGEAQICLVRSSKRLFDEDQEQYFTVDEVTTRLRCSPR
jgi:hypothetical protein